MRFRKAKKTETEMHYTPHNLTLPTGMAAHLRSANGGYSEGGMTFVQVALLERAADMIEHLAESDAKVYRLNAELGTMDTRLSEATGRHVNAEYAIARVREELSHWNHRSENMKWRIEADIEEKT